MKTLIRALTSLLTVAACSIALAQASKAISGGDSLDGEWYNPTYRYGFRIKGNVGIATITNSDRIKTGDVILKIERSSPTTFVGQKLGPNGRWGAFNGTILPDGSLRVRQGDQILPIVRVAANENAPKPQQFSVRTPPVPPGSKEMRTSAVSEPYPSGVRFAYWGSCQGDRQRVNGLLPKNLDPVNWPYYQNGDTLESFSGPAAQVAKDYAAFMRVQCPNLRPEKYPIAMLYTERMPALPPDGNRELESAAGIMRSRTHAEFIISSSSAIRANNERIEKSKKDAIAAKVKRKEEFLKRTGAVELADVGQLFRNPFAFEGKTVFLHANFYEMTSPTSGFFEIRGGGAALISDIPKGAFIDRVRTVIAARVIGKTQLKGPVPLDVLDLKMVGFEKCPGTSCPF